MINIILFISYSFLPLFLSIDPGVSDHAIYLSVAEIEHKAGGSANVKVKVFTNDMEDALMNAFGLKVNLAQTLACESNKKEIENYFSEHFLCTINGKSIRLTLTNCEGVGDATWFYFTIDCPTNWNEMKITTDYLMELFPTQSNVVSIYHNNEKRFVRLTKSNASELVKF